MSSADATIETRKHCPLSLSVKKVAAAHLRRSGLSICANGGGSVVLQSDQDDSDLVEPISLDDAWRGGLLKVNEDGSLELCGKRFSAQWDQAKIRRRLEDRLRKISSTGELIRVASCLGVDIH